MSPETRNTMIAATLILVGFGAVAYLMPAIMLAAIDVSPWLAGAVACVFLLAFFMIFWLRARLKR